MDDIAISKTEVNVCSETQGTDLDNVLSCAKYLASHNGCDTVVLDFNGSSSWTDFFIITSATSSTHLKALARHTEEFLQPKGIKPIRSTRISDDEEWCLIDYGNYIVHIMSANARAFYDLENLWFEAKKIKIEQN